jgi:hypothetical protein
VRMVRMAKVAVAGSLFAPGALTVAAMNLVWGGVGRTDQFGLHHLSREHRIALVGQPNPIPPPPGQAGTRFSCCLASVLAANRFEGEYAPGAIRADPSAFNGDETVGAFAEIAAAVGKTVLVGVDEAERALASNPFLSHQEARATFSQLLVLYAVAHHKRKVVGARRQGEEAAVPSLTVSNIESQGMSHVHRP